MDLGALELTFCGHATFAIKTPSGKHIIIDPFLEQNPACPVKLKHPSKVDALLITHTHGDHIGDVLSLVGKHQPTCIGMLETMMWLGKKGAKNIIGFNKGGTIEHDGMRITMTHAVHSCGITDGDQVIYGGEPAGYVVKFENGVSIYHAGDTCVFGDMKIIGELYKPDLALLPIGDFYTMDPLQGAYAIRLLGVKNVIPMHYGTFPVLTGTPEKLRELTRDIAGLNIIEMKPGETLTGPLKKLAAV